MNGFNRGLWIVLGLAFTVAGALGIASYAGWIAGADTRTLVPTDLVDEWVDRPVWQKLVLIGAGLVLAALGTVLIRGQLGRQRRQRWPDLSLAGTGDTGAGAERGRTIADTSAIARAVRRDLETDPRIDRASVQLTGKERDPDVWMTLALRDDADPTTITDAVDRSLSRLAGTISATPHLRQLVIDPAGRSSHRVALH